LNAADEGTESNLGGGSQAPQVDTGLLGVKPVSPPSRGKRFKAFLRWLGTGYRKEPEPSRLGVLEPLEPERLGICCSGGGLRSASFNLGALQALRHEQELGKAKYLAAVSGGSYIAASICMVAKTWPWGEDPGPGPQPDKGQPGHDDSDPSLVTRDSLPFHPQSPEEQYLRNRSTYMAPTSLDKLFLGWRVLLGLVLNLALIGLPLFACGTGLAILCYRSSYGHLAGKSGEFSADEPTWVWVALIALAAIAALLGFRLLLVRIKHDWVRRLFETWSTRTLLGLGVAALILVAIPELIALLRPSSPAKAAGGGVGGVGGLLLAALLELRSGKKADPATALPSVGKARELLRRASPKVRRAFTSTLTALVGPALLLGVVVLAASIALTYSTPTDTQAGVWLLGLVAPLVVFGVLYFVCDLGSFSLHPFYRRRLCTAFALKRVKHAAAPEGAPQARAVERDYDALVPLSESGVRPGPGGEGWPTLLVCAAANISDPGATPPGRGVSSFTFSRGAIGGPLVGGIPTDEYERRLGANRLRDITLPAAVAMSGAAISPSMGKITHAPVRILIALANLRLGVWVPNPRYVSSAHWKQRTIIRKENAKERREVGIEKIDGRPNDLLKRPRLIYLLRELLGRNRVDDRFLYVTDGGHYENLGLVELLRRGCSKIYCFDASGGKPAAALGDAIALGRSELGVEVDIDPAKVTEGEDGFAERSCVVGTIKCDGRDIGRLIYVPAVLPRDAPWDVRAYKEANPVFPHHSTADQLYTDQRFEAYRALGEHAGERARKAMNTPFPDPDQ